MKKSVNGIYRKYIEESKKKLHRDRQEGHLWKYLCLLMFTKSIVKKKKFIFKFFNKIFKK